MKRGNHSEDSGILPLRHTATASQRNLSLTHRSAPLSTVSCMSRVLNNTRSKETSSNQRSDPDHRVAPAVRVLARRPADSGAQTSKFVALHLIGVSRHTCLPYAQCRNDVTWTRRCRIRIFPSMDRKKSLWWRSEAKLFLASRHTQAPAEAVRVTSKLKNLTP